MKGLQVNLISFGKLVRQGFTFQQQEYNDEYMILWTSLDRTSSFETILTLDNIYILGPAMHMQNLLVFALPVKAHLLEPDSMAMILANVKEMDNFLLTSSQYTKSPTIQTDTIDHWHR
jgi:hypothetical protein